MKTGKLRVEGIFTLTLFIVFIAKALSSQFIYSGASDSAVGDVDSAPKPFKVDKKREKTIHKRRSHRIVSIGLFRNALTREQKIAAAGRSAHPGLTWVRPDGLSGRSRHGRGFHRPI